MILSVIIYTFIAYNNSSDIGLVVSRPKINLRHLSASLIVYQTVI